MPNADQIPAQSGLWQQGGKRATITAASSASISDGAAALVLTRASVARHKRAIAPIARILAHSTNASTPGRFPSPIKAIESVLTKTG